MKVPPFAPVFSNRDRAFDRQFQNGTVFCFGGLQVVEIQGISAVACNSTIWPTVNYEDSRHPTNCRSRSPPAVEVSGVASDEIDKPHAIPPVRCTNRSKFVEVYGVASVDLWSSLLVPCSLFLQSGRWSSKFVSDLSARSPSLRFPALQAWILMGGT